MFQFLPSTCQFIQQAIYIKLSTVPQHSLTFSPQRKTKNRKPETEQGLSLIEVLISVMLFSIMVSTLLLAASQIAKRYKFSYDRVYATLEAETMIEYATNILQVSDDWTGIIPNYGSGAGNDLRLAGGNQITNVTFNAPFNPIAPSFVNGNRTNTYAGTQYTTTLTLRSICRQNGTDDIISTGGGCGGGAYIDQNAVELQATTTWNQPESGVQNIDINTIISNLQF